VAALGAAQAGVDDYVSRLNDTNGAYFQWNIDAHQHPGPVRTRPWPSVSPASEVGPCPGGGRGIGAGQLHYDVDTSTYTAPRR
jgi:hypothetical protein